MKTKFFVARLTKASKEAYRVLSTRPDDSGGDYEYCGFSLDEVVILAKKKKVALKECVDRTRTLLLRSTLFYSSKMRCPMLEVYPHVEKALRKAVEKYNPRIGEFTHLLGRIVHLTLASYGKSVAIRRRKYVTGLQKYECFIPSVVTLQDSVGKSTLVSYHLDLKDYMELLDRKERIILWLYDCRHTLRDIADRVSLSSTAVGDKLTTMLSELRNRESRLLI